MGLASNRDAFKLQRTMMVIAGLWPKRNPSLFHVIRGLITYLWMTAFSVQLFVSVLLIKNFSELIQNWAMFVSILNCSLKVTIFYFNSPKFMDLLDFLDSAHFNYYDADLDRHVKRSINISSIMVRSFVSSAVLTVVSFSMAPVFNAKPRQLPLPFPYDLTDVSLPLYLVVYALQSGGITTAGWTSTSFDNVATSMMGLSSAYFKILKEMIVRTADCKELIAKEGGSPKDLMQFYTRFDKTINEKLTELIEHHLAIIKLAESVESIFTYIILLQFLASAGGMCLGGFTFLNSPIGSYEFIFAVSLLTTLMFQISLYCTYGNEVTLHSSRIVDACYMTEWVFCGPSVRQTLFLIMERSKRPLILTAGKLINLSLSSLVGVFRSAVSYAVVLTQLDKKH